MIRQQSRNGADRWPLAEAGCRYDPEMMTHGADKSDLAGCALKSETFCRPIAELMFNRNQFADPICQPLLDFRSIEEEAIPSSGTPDRHIFDKPKVKRISKGKPGYIFQFIVIEVTQSHGIDFDGRQSALIRF